MNLLNIRHRTTYRYREPVQLGPHRFMLRPREGHDLHLLSGKLDVAPAATLSWANDIFGNAVATAQFAQAADRLVIESLAVVELAAAPCPKRTFMPGELFRGLFRTAMLKCRVAWGGETCDGARSSQALESWRLRGRSPCGPSRRRRVASDCCPSRLGKRKCFAKPWARWATAKGRTS
jgi:hypothetical protein